MLHPVTVEICDLAGALSVRLLRGHANYDLDQMLRFEPLLLEKLQLSTSLKSEADVVSHGRALHTALKAHASVARELESLFSQGIVPTVLKFYITTSAASLYRWEALCSLHKQSFLATQHSCSLNRIAIGSSPLVSELREFTGTLTFAAFLSPCGVNARNECEALINSITAARLSGLNIRTYLYVGEQELLDIADEMLAGVEDIEVRPIPHNALELEAAIKADRAQVLHFFCHGYVREGVAMLEFGSITDHDIAAPAGSIRFSLDRLEQSLAATGTAWLTVLNSCSGAASVPKLSSMAATLAKTVSPVAIGMAEPINDQDASCFAEHFYPRALKIISDSVASLLPGKSTYIDLSSAADTARLELYRKAQIGETDGFGRWCLPIVYLRDPPLKVVHADSDTKTRIDVVAMALQNLPPGTPQGLRSDILNVLGNPPAVPSGLWPDLNGNFQ
jgi:hypothetical protein